jgi:hypothetical protein
MTVMAVDVGATKTARMPSAAMAVDAARWRLSRRRALAWDTEIARSSGIIAGEFCRSASVDG